MAWQIKPRLILAGSGLTAPIAWLVARSMGAKVGVYLHGLDVIAPSCIYQRFWLPFIRRCDITLVNSANTARLARKRGVRLENMQVLHPGTDIPVLDPQAGTMFRKRFDIAPQFILLSVGRLTQRKGLSEFVERALPMIISKHPDTLLVVIGDEASDALNTRAGSERDRILAAGRNVGIESSIRFLGRCDEATLGAAYQAANLHIFPVLELPGDVEGFGMVALESAAHGLPTVGFDVGGVADAVENACTGTLVKAGDYAALSQAVLNQLGQGTSQVTIAACRAFAANKAWPEFGKRLRNLLSSLHE
jgi:phosphatidylinositol alpha-1,6-mannosyltransferase